MKKLAFAIVIASTVAGCESKFAESSPEAVGIRGPKLEERLEQKKQIDSKLNAVEKSIEKVKVVVELLKGIYTSTGEKLAYSPIDFVLDMNTELKKRIPENSNDRLVRYGKINLPIKGLSEQCKTVETMLSNTAVEQADSVVENLSYSLKSCKTEDFKEVLLANVTGTKVQFDIQTKNLESIFSLSDFKESLNSAKCQTTFGSENSISAITCEDIQLLISETRSVIFKSIHFDSQSADQVQALAHLIEDNKLKGSAFITVSKSGELRVKTANADEAQQNAN